MPYKPNILVWTLVFIIAILTLEILQPTILSINAATLPGILKQVMILVQHFFTVTPIALLAGFAWSLFGYLRYKLGDVTVQYDVNKLYETWMWYEGLIILIAVALPPGQAAAITTVIMAVKSVFNKLKTPLPYIKGSTCN